MKLILGSASPRRKQILTEMGFTFDVIKPDINEKVIRDPDPRKLVLALACAKADAIIAKINEPAIVITSDQVVSFHGKILEKPETLEEARQMLKAYRDNINSTVTSVVVTNTKTGQRFSGVDVADVQFGNFSDDTIEEIVQNKEVNVLDRAGGYAANHPLFQSRIKILGEYESVVGLPKALTLKLLSQAGGTL